MDSFVMALEIVHIRACVVQGLVGSETFVWETVRE